MKKTLIATAIAGAMGFSVAAQAAPTVYGNIQLGVNLTDKKNTAAAGKPDNSYGAMSAFDNGSTIGFKGEEALNNGLTGIYKAEFEFGAGDMKGEEKGLINGDQAYLGVKGGFGTVRVGSFDTIANDFVQDMVYVTEYLSFNEAIGQNNEATEAVQVQYTGEFGGVKVGVSTQLNSQYEYANNADGKKAEDAENAMQIGVIVPAGPAKVSFAYDSVEGDMGVGFKMPVAGGVTLGAKYEMGNAAEGGEDETVIAASVDMKYSAGNVYLMASSADVADTNGFGLGATYSLSDNVYTFIEVGSGDAEKKEKMSGSVIGAVVSF